MANRLVSCKKVIAQFYRNYKPSNSGFVDDAIEWIGDAIDIMKCGIQYIEDHKDLEIEDYKVELPCAIEEILGITYNGYRLVRNDGVSIKYGLSCNAPYGANSYKINNNNIKTSFETGCIRVYYLALPVDCDGYPMVLDDAKYRAALVWFILMNMCTRGFRHPVFNYQMASAEWEKAYPKAQNAARLIRLDTDGMENLKHHFLGIIPNINRANEFYRTNGAAYNDDSFTPGQNLQSVQILGERSEE